MKAAALALLAALAVQPAVAAGWGQYHNDRYGYSIAVPPGFSGHGEPDRHDGQLFTGPAGASLSVWGGVPADDFSTEERRRIDALTAEGWTLTGRTTTPNWGHWSARKAGRVIDLRAIAGCGGRRYAMFAFEYGLAELFRYQPVSSRLAGSLRQTTCP